MKKYISTAILTFYACTTFAQFVTLDISQQTNRKTDRQQLTWDRNDTRTTQTVRKNITISAKTSKDVELIICLFYSSGGEVEKDFFTDVATPNRPFEKTFTPPIASQEDVKIAYARYGWGNDYKRRSGDAKIMTCFFAFNKRTGKFLGKKSTSPKIEKVAMTYFKEDIEHYVKQNCTRKK